MPCCIAHLCTCTYTNIHGKSRAQQASTEETTHSTTQPHKITKIFLKTQWLRKFNSHNGLENLTATMALTEVLQ